MIMPPDCSPCPLAPGAKLFHAPQTDGKQPLLRELHWQADEVSPGGGKAGIPKMPAPGLITGPRVKVIQGRAAPSHSLVPMTFIGARAGFQFSFC